MQPEPVVTLRQSRRQYLVMQARGAAIAKEKAEDKTRAALKHGVAYRRRITLL
jgi:hypothetical protein